MVKIVKLVKYDLNQFFKGTGFVMPFIVLIAFLGFMYSQKPIGVLSGFLLTEVVLFYIMVWSGVTIAGKENEQEEQILLMRMNSNIKYYIGKICTILVIALIYTIISVVFPLFANVINGNCLFDRNLVGSDIIYSFLMIFGSAMCGGIMGNMFHPRVVVDRKAGHGICALLSVASLAKPVMIKEVAAFKYILWVVPDVMGASASVGGDTYFDIGQTLMVFCSFVIYGIVYATIKNVVCMKRKF